MSIKILTTKELSDQNLAGLEGAIGQTSPIADKAFLRVLAAVLALGHTGLYKYAAERAKQNLAQTATGSDLDLIGAEFDVTRKASETAVIEATVTGLDETIISATSSFIGDANGVRYYVDSSVEIVGGTATISLTAEVSGVAGNLQIGDGLTIVSPVAGLASTATVSTLVTTGAENETDAVYRPRVQFAMRATTGGSNATDHKIWAEEIAGVSRAFPYAGKPVGGGTSYPGDRTVYIEADSSIDPDGIAPLSLLDDVRANINLYTTLGLTDETLYTESITRISVDLTITNLTTPAGQDATVKAAIVDALDLYFQQLSAYVEGVDLERDRNDRITALTLSDIVQGVLSSMASSAEDVAFEVAATPYNTYQLSAGELTKTGTITYAVV